MPIHNHTHKYLGAHGSTQSRSRLNSTVAGRPTLNVELMLAVSCLWLTNSTFIPVHDRRHVRVSFRIFIEGGGAKAMTTELRGARIIVVLCYFYENICEACTPAGTFWRIRIKNSLLVIKSLCKVGIVCMQGFLWAKTFEGEREEKLD